MPDATQPRRGDIWFVKLPTDPPDKGLRPVVVVSREERNQHPRALTVLVAPLSTTPARTRTHLELAPGETNLQERSCVKAENLMTVLKSDLVAPRQPLRRLTSLRLREIAKAVLVAMDCEDLLR